jgi:hypothetical protein
LDVPGNIQRVGTHTRCIQLTREDHGMLTRNIGSQTITIISHTRVQPLGVGAQGAKTREADPARIHSANRIGDEKTNSDTKELPGGEPGALQVEVDETQWSLEKPLRRATAVQTEHVTGSQHEWRWRRPNPTARTPDKTKARPTAKRGRPATCQSTPAARESTKRRT